MNEPMTKGQGQTIIDEFKRLNKNFDDIKDDIRDIKDDMSDMKDDIDVIAQTDDEKSCILQLILHIYTDLSIGTVQEIRKIDGYHNFSWDWSGDNIPNNYKTPKTSEIINN